jgi:polyphosphate glucokinase
MPSFGIDIGGSGIKGAPVDLSTGTLISPRVRLPTPEDAKPEDIAEVVLQITQHFDWKGNIGCGFPAVIRNGTALTAANVDHSWINTNIDQLFSEKTQCPTRVINDADAAGLAEMTFGAGKGWEKGVVLLVTVGTGLGTALFVDGHLFPNTELGHIQIRGKDAERRASDAARVRKELSWEAWADRFNEYLQEIERLLYPNLIIVGGGASKEFNRFAGAIKVHAQVVPAQLLNNAGIVGAALGAEIN